MRVMRNVNYKSVVSGEWSVKRVMRKAFIIGGILVLVLKANFSLNAQPNSDNLYSKPLKEVLSDVQKKYGVTIKFADSMVAKKSVTYAEWKYRQDVEETLDNIMRPLERKVKKEKKKQCKLKV